MDPTKVTRRGVFGRPMTRIKAQIPDAVARLTAAAFRKYETALHRYVLRRLQRPEDAPDVTQEIFERFMKVDRTEAIRNPQAYLFGIASHVVSEARYHEEHNPVTYDSELANERSDAFDPGATDELADTLGMQRDLINALLTLPDAHLAAVLLVKGEGLSYEEAAQKAGFTEATIGTYLTHARAKLKLVLEDYWHNKGSSK
jgi:RNA polymerase sigma factor (sigma-70 family)